MDKVYLRSSWLKVSYEFNFSRIGWPWSLNYGLNCSYVRKQVHVKYVLSMYLFFYFIALHSTFVSLSIGVISTKPSLIVIWLEVYARYVRSSRATFGTASGMFAKRAQACCHLASLKQSVSQLWFWYHLYLTLFMQSRFAFAYRLNEGHILSCYLCTLSETDYLQRPGLSHKSVQNFCFSNTNLIFKASGFILTFFQSRISL